MRDHDRVAHRVRSYERSTLRTCEVSTGGALSPTHILRSLSAALIRRFRSPRGKTRRFAEADGNATLTLHASLGRLTQRFRSPRGARVTFLCLVKGK